MAQLLTAPSPIRHDFSRKAFAQKQCSLTSTANQKVNCQKMQFHHVENFRCILSSTCRSRLVIKITLQHRWNFMPMHTDACQEGGGASKHSGQRCGAGTGGTRLPSGCSWELVGLQTSQSASQVNGTWRTICTRHSFGWKPCCSKPYLGSRIFLKFFFFGFLFSFVLICLILLICGEVFSLKAAVGMQTFVKLITIIKT